MHSVPELPQEHSHQVNLSCIIFLLQQKVFSGQLHAMQGQDSNFLHNGVTRDMLHQPAQEPSSPLHDGGLAQQVRGQAALHQPVQELPPPLQDGGFAHQVRGRDVLLQPVADLSLPPPDTDVLNLPVAETPPLQVGGFPQQEKNLVNPDSTSSVEMLFKIFSSGWFRFLLLLSMLN